MVSFQTVLTEYLRLQPNQQVSNQQEEFCLQIKGKAGSAILADREMSTAVREKRNCFQNKVCDVAIELTNYESKSHVRDCTLRGCDCTTRKC